MTWCIFTLHLLKIHNWKLHKFSNNTLHGCCSTNLPLIQPLVLLQLWSFLHNDGICFARQKHPEYQALLQTDIVCKWVGQWPWARLANQQRCWCHPEGAGEGEAGEWSKVGEDCSHLGEKLNWMRYDLSCSHTYTQIKGSHELLLHQLQPEQSHIVTLLCKTGQEVPQDPHMIPGIQIF